MDKATPDSVMALATDLWHADGGEPFRIKRNELRAEVERLAAQSAPTEPVVTKDQRELIAKLRYMGKQYAAGQFARGGVPQKHYLEEAADEIEMMAWALNMNEKTPGSAQENADLRNVIQAACIDGIPGLERAWAKYFPGKPITVSPGAVAQSAPLAQQAREYPPLPARAFSIDAGSGGSVPGYSADQMRAYVDADRAAAQVEPVRMLLASDVETIKRALDELNRGRVIPADGEVRNGS